MIKLNLPKNKKEQFKDVPFVEDMSVYSLKVLIKNLYKAVQELANVLDETRPDAAAECDSLLDGKPFNKRNIDDKYIYANYHGYILRFDTKTKRFLILNEEYQPLETPIQGFTYQEIETRVKDAKRKAA